MVKAFIKHVLGVGSAHRGLYGPTSAYYAAVEQQGRLTLHLHSMVWIRGALSPQTIRDRLLAGDNAFETEMIRYLEEMHTGHFLTGDLEAIKARPRSSSQPYQDPTQTLPIPPPPPCACSRASKSCTCRERRSSWWRTFQETVDDLIFRVQMHRCIRKRSARIASSSAQVKKDPLEGIKGCKGDDGVCEARFPREYVPKSYVDRLTGAIHVVKKEVMMNCVTPVLTYLTRGNTDTTSLQSGTSMKAVVMYVSDYITKCSLKTYHIMSCIKSVFERSAPTFEGSKKDGESARKLMMQMVNALAPRMEIGSPMAASYLLGMPDHYTSHEFVVFWWRSFVNRVLDDWPDGGQSATFEERLVLRKEQGQLIGTSIVDDYVHRPRKYENYTLYEWVQCAKKSKRTPTQLKNFVEADEGPSGPAVGEEGEAVDGGPTSRPHGTTLCAPDVLAILDRTPKAVDLMDGDQKSPMAINRQPPYEPFAETHPQYTSHHVWCDPSKRDYIVPNFVGGAIPRNDQGDCEYYCATMLTLFSPWRRGRDLKREGYNWDHAFRQHRFSEREVQLMENFNLRYECADARDDFRNELSKKKRVNTVSTDFDDDSDGEDAHRSFNARYGEDLDYDAPPDGETGPMWNRTYQTIQQTKTYAGTSGWTQRLKDTLPGFCPDSISGVQIRRRGSEWAEYIQQTRQKIFQQKFKGNSTSRNTHANSTGNNGDGTHVSGVVELPASYFTNDYSDDKPDLKTMIDDVSREFNLNTEQLRAFTLIANHA
ncbi:hypothetical protein FB107DRAFT_190974, partial [Schizophyllum commune]